MMAQALLQPIDKSLTITDHAALILGFARNLLQAGVVASSPQNGSRSKMGRFDVTSLRYERAKDALLDAIHLARLYEYRDVPFFLSHQAILAVHKRLERNGQATEKYLRLLQNANHQVFICEVEDVLDRASNPNFEAAQSKRGYGGDKAEIIAKLRQVIAGYAKAQQQLGMELPSEFDSAKANALIVLVRHAREQATIKDALKKANWSLHRVQAEFDLGRVLLPNDIHKHPEAVVWLMIVDGRLCLSADVWRGSIIMPNRYRSSAGHKTEPVILAKFLLRELWLEWDAGRDVFRVTIETGQMQTRFHSSNGAQIVTGVSTATPMTLCVGAIG